MAWNDLCGGKLVDGKAIDLKTLIGVGVDHDKRGKTDLPNATALGNMVQAADKLKLKEGNGKGISFTIAEAPSLPTTASTRRRSSRTSSTPRTARASATKTPSCRWPPSAPAMCSCTRASRHASVAAPATRRGRSSSARPSSSPRTTATTARRTTRPSSSRRPGSCSTADGWTRGHRPEPEPPGARRFHPSGTGWIASGPLPREAIGRITAACSAVQP
jgi:hypothetical protein